MPDSLVIFLHGVGSRGADLARLAEPLGAVLPAAAFAAPDGPFPFDRGGSGCQWFSIAGVNEANRAGRVADARATFDRTVAGCIAAAGLADRPDRVALVGFSQGSIMALDALATGRWPVAAIVAFSGRLATAGPLAPSPRTHALLIHGAADAVIAASESAAAEASLTRAGAHVATAILPRLAHGISPEGIALAGTFLAEHLSGPAGQDGRQARSHP